MSFFDFSSDIDKELVSETVIRIAISVILLVMIVVLSYWQHVKMEKQFIINFTRGLVQIVIMASFLLLIFEIENVFLLFGYLVFMCLFAALTAKGKFKIVNIFRIQFIAISVAGLSIMGIVVITGIIPATGEFIIPMGGMIISNVMVINGIFMNRLISDMKKAKGEIEAALALGDSPSNSIKTIIIESYRAGLVPSTDRVAVLGIVTIPGLMSGMIIGGENPIVAAVYQIIIFLMILSSGFIGEIISGKLLMKEFFTEEDQLKSL
ncbi:MAG: ABC transporter permease [Candidatus Kariarchaeaceae archaeon]